MVVRLDSKHEYVRTSSIYSVYW